jgi:hypothetical protein
MKFVVCAEKKQQAEILFMSLELALGKMDRRLDVVGLINVLGC